MIPPSLHPHFLRSEITELSPPFGLFALISRLSVGGKLSWLGETLVQVGGSIDSFTLGVLEGTEETADCLGDRRVG